MLSVKDAGEEKLASVEERENEEKESEGVHPAALWPIHPMQRDFGSLWKQRADGMRHFGRAALDL